MTAGGGGGIGTAPGGNMTVSSGPSAMTASAATQSGMPSGGGGGGGNATMTDNFNFLRGGWQTNDQGIVTFNTIYPGFCERILLSVYTHLTWS